MAGFTAKIDTINFNTSSFTRALADDCRKLIRMAAQKWLVAVLRRIPVRTGFLAGAFTPLENLVGSVNKSTGAINISRNPLLSREKKIDYLTKKLRTLQGSIEKSNKRLTSLGKAHSEGLAEQAIDKNKRLKAEHHAMRVEQQIKNVEKKIRELLGIRSRTRGGVGQLEVMRRLEMLRQKRVKLGYFKSRGPYNPIIRKTSARYHTVEEEIYATKQIIVGQQHTQKERMEAIRKKIKLEKERIEIVKELIGHQNVKAIKKFGTRVRAFGEYYRYPGGKVLKTPRSGVEFATPEAEIFQEFSEAENSQAKEVLSSFQQQIEATRKFLGTSTAVEKLGDEATLTEPTIDKMYKSAMQQMKDSKVFFTFKFEVSIIYWTINDQFERKLTGKNQTFNISRQQSIPWHSLQAGNAAFMQFINSAIRGNQQLKSLRQIEDFLIKRTINFDGSMSSANEVKRVFVDIPKS